MEDAIPPKNTSISSDADESTLCALCGRESICGGLGYVRYDLPVDHPQFGQLFRCPNNQADPQRKEKLRKLGNLEAFADKTFDTFQTDVPMLTPGQQKSLAYALNVAKNYAANPEGWLLIEGTYGCGKTHLAAAVSNVRLEREEEVLFITTPDLLDYLRGTYGPSSEVSYDEMFDRLRTAPLLVLDDLGVENPSAWAQEKLFQLLNYRYTHRLPTVITTNTDPDLLDPRIRSRLLDEGLIRRIKIDAPDYRSPLFNQREQLSNLSLYNEMTFQTFDTRTKTLPEERRNLERALSIAQAYAEQPTGWLVLHGGYGSGKTHLAAAIGNEQQSRGVNVIFATIPELLDQLKETFKPDSTVTFDYRFQMVKNAPLLILDDLGGEVPTRWVKEKLFQIIDHRYVKRLPTVITTTLTIDEIDARIRSRLQDRRICARFTITAEAYASRLSREKA